MNIGLGIYEIFARIIPGIVYLVALVQLGFILELISFDLQIFYDLKIVPVTGLVLLAYVLETTFYPIAILWNRLFRRKYAPDEAFAEFQKRNPSWIYKFEGKDWRTLFAYIRKESPVLASEIDKQFAFYLMLGSMSIGIILLAINQMILFVQGGTYQNIIYSVFLIIASLIIAREGRFFQSRFYSWIFETILSYQLNIENFITPDKNTASSKPKSTKS
jgi:hypothetical protein